MSVADRILELAAARGPRVVTSALDIASAAGLEAYARGGNAFDAALAACFMETVALPMKCGLAGDVVALFRRAGEPLQALVSVGPGPAALAAGAILERLGPRSVGIPGAPDGYATLHAFARLKLATLIRPATAAAAAGVAWNRVSLSYLHESVELLRKYNSATPYMPGDRMPVEGDLSRLPDLGALLERFARHGAALFAHEDGDRLLVRLHAGGGILTVADLQLRPARLMEPAQVVIGDATLIGTPTPTGGARLLPMVQQALQEGQPLVEIIRAERTAAKARGRMAEDGGTSVVTAADEHGNAVVIVHSNSFPRFGSGVVLADGLVLNNRPGRGFDLAAPPGSPAAPRAGRTPPTTLHAWAIQRPGRLVMGATPGGINQLPWNLQTVTELLQGRSARATVCAPRWALDEADVLSVEAGAAIPEGLAHTPVPPLSLRSAQQVLDLPERGLLLAAADPRVAACALASY
jgi:gamma-glutamyltranspeptidase/glutathione hydrolase